MGRNVCRDKYIILLRTESERQTYREREREGMKAKMTWTIEKENENEFLERGKEKCVLETD